MVFEQKKIEIQVFGPREQTFLCSTQEQDHM